MNCRWKSSCPIFVLGPVAFVGLPVLEQLAPEGPEVHKEELGPCAIREAELWSTHSDPGVHV